MSAFATGDKAKKTKPRKRAQPVWRRGGFRIAMIATVAFALGAASWWSWRAGHVERLSALAVGGVVELTASMGLRVEEVLVVGRRETARDALLMALGTARGDAILAFDAAAARLRVEALPWVRAASVERLLPGTVLLTVEERRPLALWQNKGRFALIDYDGVTIAGASFERFRDLLIVVGEDAPAYAAGLLEMLGSEPALMAQVRAAVRVGGRRWNLRMKDDIDVRLPEEGAATAWLRLAEYERSHQVLARDVDVVDLRVPDRLIVRKLGDGGNDVQSVGHDGQET